MKIQGKVFYRQSFPIIPKNTPIKINELLIQKIIMNLQNVLNYLNNFDVKDSVRLTGGNIVVLSVIQDKPH